MRNQQLDMPYRFPCSSPGIALQAEPRIGVEASVSHCLMSWNVRSPSRRATCHTEARPPLLRPPVTDPCCAGSKWKRKAKQARQVLLQRHAPNFVNRSHAAATPRLLTCRSTGRSDTDAPACRKQTRSYFAVHRRMACTTHCGRASAHKMEFNI